MHRGAADLCTTCDANEESHKPEKNLKKSVKQDRWKQIRLILKKKDVQTIEHELSIERKLNKRLQS